MSVEARLHIAGGEEASWVSIPPLRPLPRWVTIDVFDEPDIEFALEIKAVLDAAEIRYVADTLRVKRASTASPEITNAALRPLRLHEYMRRGLLQVLPHLRDLGDGVQQVATEYGSNSRQTLTAVAEVFLAAQILNEPPAKAVQSAFKISAPTASAWIRRARDLRFLALGTPPPNPDESYIRDRFDATRRVLDGSADG
jgi:hypothetical protein